MARIVHILRRLVPEEWGGTETVVTQLCRQQQARGHDVEIVCTSALSRPGLGEIEGIPVRRFSYWYANWPLSRQERRQLDGKGGNPLSFSLLRYLQRRPAPDLFHVHADARLGAMARFAARRLGTPYVLSFHGGYYDVPPAEKLQLQQAVRHKLDWGKPAGWFLGTRRLLDDAAALLFVNPSDAEQASRLFPEKKIAHLPNGVDLARWSSSGPDEFLRRFSLAGKRLILCVARIDPQKDQKTLVRAFQRVAQAEPRAHLVLLGPVSVPGYDREIQAEARQSGLEAQLTMLPGLPPESPLLPAAYQAAEICVLPSRHEPFGITALEAWAARRPVVASEVGGLGRLVGEHEAGLLFPPGDHEALARHLHGLLKSPTRSRALAERGFRAVARHYAWPAIAERLEAIYATIGMERNQRWQPQPQASWLFTVVNRFAARRSLPGPSTTGASKS